MQRPNLNNIPNAILTSDWHLREDVPESRTDDYWTAQWRKVDFVKALQAKYNCPVYHAGDLYDHWKPSPNLSRETVLHLPAQFYTIYGQHDLPNHNLQLVDKCGINLLQAAGKLRVLPECHWNQTPTEGSLYLPTYDCHVLVWHIMNYQGKLPWPDCPSPLSAGLLRKYNKFSLIITGDNHKCFTETHEGRVLVNPGSLMRMDADQVDHKPSVFLWFAETNSVERIYIPIEAGVISREHLEIKEERDARIEAVVERLSDDYVAGMSYEENLEAFEKANQVRTSVMEIVYRSLEPIKQ